MLKIAKRAYRLRDEFFRVDPDDHNAQRDKMLAIKREIGHEIGDVGVFKELFTDELLGGMNEVDPHRERVIALLDEVFGE